MTLKFDDILERLKGRIQRCPPDDCWIWTGAKTQPRTRIISKTRRTYDFSPERVPSVVHPYAVFQYKKKRTSVHRFLARAKEKQRMENLCRNTLCVNPKHWLFPEIEIETCFDPETEIEDCKNVIDGIGIPRNLIYEDLRKDDRLIDYSDKAIKQALEEMK